MQLSEYVPLPESMLEVVEASPDAPALGTVAKIQLALALNELIGEGGREGGREGGWSETQRESKRAVCSRPDGLQVRKAIGHAINQHGDAAVLCNFLSSAIFCPLKFFVVRNCSVHELAQGLFGWGLHCQSRLE